MITCAVSQPLPADTLGRIGRTLKVQEVVSVPAIEMFWASSSRRPGRFSCSVSLLSNISSKTVWLSFPSSRLFLTRSMFDSNSCQKSDTC